MAVPTTQELLDANRTAQKRILDQLYAALPNLVGTDFDKWVDSTEASQGMKNSQRIGQLVDAYKALQVVEKGLVSQLADGAAPYSVNRQFAIQVNEIGADTTEYADGED